MKAEQKIGKVMDTGTQLNLSKHMGWLVLGSVMKIIYKLITLLLCFLLSTAWIALSIIVRTAFIVVLGAVLSLMLKIAGIAFIL